MAQPDGIAQGLDCVFRSPEGCHVCTLFDLANCHLVRRELATAQGKVRPGGWGGRGRNTRDGTHPTLE